MNGCIQRKLAFGHTTQTLTLKRDQAVTEIVPQNMPINWDPTRACVEALQNPIGTDTLGTLVQRKKPQKVVIVVNDITRPTPYQHMLPPLLQELTDNGITNEQIVFVVATGIHRPNTEEENASTLGIEIVEKYRVLNHDCDQHLMQVGVLPDDTLLVINREVAQADMVIVTGVISLHYFAGYSGGRKSILPGVASRNLITGNHARMTEEGADTGNIITNPVHHTMMAAARLAGVDFILNVVTAGKDIIAAVAGDVKQAWLKGVEICAQQSTVKIPALADVVIASAGGHPKDINLYQAQKALDNAARATKMNGTIILLAACTEGYGEATFARWMKEAQKLEDIEVRLQTAFELGGHKAFAIARVVKHKKVILISEMSKEETEACFFTYAASLDEAIAMAAAQHGPDFTTYLMPQASAVLPILDPAISS